MPSPTQSLFRATILDLHALVDSLLSDEALASALSAPTIMGLREIRICAHDDPDGTTFPLLARRMKEAAERLGFTEPSPLRDVTMAAHHLALCALEPGPLTTRRHIFEARIALRTQRARSGAPMSPDPRFPTKHLVDP